MIQLDYDAQHLSNMALGTTLLSIAAVLLVVTVLGFIFLRTNRYVAPVIAMFLALALVNAAVAGSTLVAEDARTQGKALDVQRQLAVRYGLILTDRQAVTLVQTKRSTATRVGGRTVSVSLLPTANATRFRVVV